MDKKQYLISVFERLARESPTIAEYGAVLKEGRLSENEIGELYALVSETMESTAAEMTQGCATALAALLSGLREKEREESRNEKAETVLETFF